MPDGVLLIIDKKKRNKKKMPQCIELDCEPFQVRPDVHMKQVIKETGLPTRDPCSTRFGRWAWDYSDVPLERWIQVLPVIKERIIGLFEQHCIRYGAWE